MTISVKKLMRIKNISLYLLFIVSCIFLFVENAPAQHHLPKSKIVEKIPESLIELGNNSSYALIVQKSAQKLYIYNGEYIREKSFPVTTGKRKGNKKETGDKKTPEGIYFFSNILEDRNLLPEYGIMALTTNYPNLMDKIMKKNGYGIWLHATDKPSRLIKPYDTKGCVVASNDAVLEIARHVELETTPIVIVKDITYTTRDALKKGKEEIVKFIEKWLKAWNKKNIDRYISAYSGRFFSRGMNRNDWKQYKERLNNKYSLIKVEIDNLKIFKYENYYVATFYQHYTSDQLSDKGIKRLYITNERSKLRIIAEEWIKLPVRNPKEIATAYIQKRKIKLISEQKLVGSKQNNRFIDF